MSQLILIDRDTKQEIGRRPMDPAERYVLYASCAEYELLSHEANEYTMHTVAWRLPEENCVVSVTAHGKARMSCGCTMGYCTCC